MKRLALLALLLASSWADAAPAPLPKPQRKAERPAPGRPALSAHGDRVEVEIVVVNLGFVGGQVGANVVIGAQAQQQQQPQAQPPKADPPG